MICERLNIIVNYQGLTPRAFALKIGVSPQRFGNYLKDRDPDYATLKKIVETFIDVSPEWLLTGKGEMLKAKTPAPMGDHDAARAAIYKEELDECRIRIEELVKENTRLEERLLLAGSFRNIPIPHDRNARKVRDMPEPLVEPRADHLKKPPEQLKKGTK